MWSTKICNLQHLLIILVRKIALIIYYNISKRIESQELKRNVKPENVKGQKARNEATWQRDDREALH